MSDQQSQCHVPSAKAKKKRDNHYVQMLMNTIRTYRGSITPYEIANDLGIPAQPIYRLDKDKAASADNILRYLVWAYRRWPEVMATYIGRLDLYKACHDQEQICASAIDEADRLAQAEKRRKEREKKALLSDVRKEVRAELESKMQEEIAARLAELTAQSEQAKRQTVENANERIECLHSQQQAMIDAAVAAERHRNEATIKYLMAQFDEYKKVTQDILTNQGKGMDQTNEMMKKLIDSANALRVAVDALQ